VTPGKPGRDRGIGLRYKDVPFTIKGGAPPKGSGCQVINADLSSTAPTVAEQRPDDPMSTADLQFYNCGDHAKVRLGTRVERVAEVSGSPDMRSCAMAARKNAMLDRDIELSDLHPGRAFCEFDTMDLSSVYLLRVKSVSPATRSMTWTATYWWDPNAPAE
jgi:hypothetical protein